MSSSIVDRNRADYFRFYRFGMTPEVFNSAFEKQSGKCAICEKELDAYGSDTCIDHDHNSGLLRWILCKRCNAGIGYFTDNPILLRKAAELLEKQDFSFGVGNE